MASQEPPGRARLVVQLNAPLQPVHRGSVFEDRLIAFVESRPGGAAVTGGGTRVADDGSGPKSCHIELSLPAADAQEAHVIIDFLDRIGAPRGSSALLDGQEFVRFGSTEGFGLFLNGTDLPQEVYANSDVNELIGQLRAALGREGTLVSWWEGPQETALYFLGRSFAQMRGQASPVVRSHPLGQLSRLERIA